MVVLENRLFLNGVLYAVLGLVGRLLRLEVYQTARVLPVFKDTLLRRDLSRVFSS